MSSPWESTAIPGVFRTTRPALVDDRGSFTKVLGEGDGAFAPREVFWSHSSRGVFRGLHVPLPPRVARKLVFVTSGEVRDFIVDLRAGSPEYGRLHEFALHERSGGLVIPEGCAHGFEVVSAAASMVYLQEDFHHADCDGGIHYASAGVTLTSRDPIVSDRDRALPTLDAYETPFRFA